MQGNISKIQVKLQSPVEYTLTLGGQSLVLNSLLGKKIQLEWTQKIFCVHCHKAIKKSYSQGYCYPCSIQLPQCDLCILKPEQCHFHLGTCRDPSWGEEYCMIPHTVYLAYSSNIKVGITRAYQQTTRWIHQGAVQALAIGNVKNRYQSGLVEIALKTKIQDKTNWKKMLQFQDPKTVDLEKYWDNLKNLWPENIPNLLSPTKPILINYPVLEYPNQIVSHNLEKEPILTDTLKGIKGSYLIFLEKVINLKKHIGYEISLSF